MNFDQIVAKYPGEQYQAHLGLFLPYTSGHGTLKSAASYCL